jgi:hypothetical protein
MNPDQASQIASHTAHMLRAIRSATNSRDLKQLGDEFFRYANSHGVCLQIREHVGQAVGQTSLSLRAASERNAAETSKRMTGERE